MCSNTLVLSVFKTGADVMKKPKVADGEMSVSTHLASVGGQKMPEFSRTEVKARSPRPLKCLAPDSMWSTGRFWVNGGYSEQGIPIDAELGGPGGGEGMRVGVWTNRQYHSGIGKENLAGV